MIETKKVELRGSPNADKFFREMYEKDCKYANDLTAFGWQKTEVIQERHGRSTYDYQILAREKDMPNYEKLSSLEKRYELAKSNLRTYSGIDFLTALLLFLLFIVPGVIYVVYKNTKKEEIETNNYKCEQTMKAAVKDALGIKKNV